MLKWSVYQCKFTYGAGALGIATVASDLWRHVIPVWALIAVAVVPLAIFLIGPSLLPDRILGIAQLFGATWYSAIVVIAVLALFSAHALDFGKCLMMLFLIPGLIPTLIILNQWCSGRLFKPIPPSYDHFDH